MTPVSSVREVTCRLWLAFFTVAAFVGAVCSPIDHAGSDPKGVLLTSQAIVCFGSARLDEYAAHENSWVGPQQPDRFVYRGGHIYRRNPMAPSLLCVPFVWMANLQGMDLHKPKTDAAVQNVLSALLVASAVLLSYSLSRRFLEPGQALLLTLGFVFGGPLTSTMGTALWNSGFAAVLGMAGMVVLSDIGMGRKPSLALLAGLLVCAVFSRPTMVVLTGLAVAYVWVVQRRAVLRFLAFLVGLTGFALVVHLFLYDGFVLDYYSPSRLARPWLFLLSVGCVAAGSVLLVTRVINQRSMQGWIRTLRRDTGGEATAPENGLRSGRWARCCRTATSIVVLGLALCAVLFLPQVLNRSGVTRSSLLPNQREVIETVRAGYGALLSPGRGVLVYSPYLLLTLCGVSFRWSSLRRNPLFWLAAVWFVLHTVVVARPVRWHGGHCFGSRLYLDAFPALMVMTLLVWHGARHSGRRQRYVRGLLAVAVGFSVFINAYQGMFNRWTVLWNRDPDVDRHPECLLDWRYPQFLASPAQLEARMAEYQRHLASEATQSTTLVSRDQPGPDTGRDPTTE